MLAPVHLITSPALHPIKRCVVKAFGLATNQHCFGARLASLAARILTAAEQGLAEEEALKEWQKSPASSRAASFTARRDFQALFARDTSAGKLKYKWS